MIPNISMKQNCQYFFEVVGVVVPDLFSEKLVEAGVAYLVRELI